MSDVEIRFATPEDAHGINGIYNPYIEKSPATFETEPYDEAQRRRWIDSHCPDPRYPVFVAERDRAIVGFANASAFDEREGYRTSVKVSVFVATEHHGGGIASALYQTLFDALKLQSLHRAYALIVRPNEASEVLHRKFGFRHISTLSEVGRKFGRFHDVMWFEKAL